MPGLVWVDNFSQYPLGQLPSGIWTGRSLPTVATQGRNGGQRVTWNKNAMVRAGNVSFFRASYRIDSGGTPITAFMAEVGYPGSTLTSAHWICGGSWYGYGYAGLIVTEDGAIHAVRGGAFESGPNSTNVSLIGSSAPGAIPIRRGWFLLEVAFVWAKVGSVTVRVNGKLVLLALGNTKSPEDFCVQILKQPACPIESDDLWPEEVTEFGIGGFTRGGQYTAGLQGWTGSIDILAAFDVDPGDISDIAVADLIPDGDGAVSESTIAGTTPAPTRWQSVDDALSPDGDTTKVVFDDVSAPAEDEYTLTAFPFGAAVIYGVQNSAYHKVLYPGYSSSALGVSDGTNVVYGAPLFSRARAYTSQASPSPEKPSGGAWSVGDLANLRVRVRRNV